MWKRFVSVVLNRENLLALLVALLLLAIAIFTSDATPAWIYQGF